MDKKRAVLNIAIGIVFKIVLLLLSVVSKSFVVRHLGDEANGLLTLYTSILGFLSIAEIGIGSAISFSMYKPISENNNEVVSGLFFLYKKFYRIIMMIILVLGLILMPFVPMLAKGNTGSINILLTYFIFLISVLITYLFAHKTSLINAYKDNYLTTSSYSISLILEAIIQIIVIILTKNFIYFLLVKIISHTINGLIDDYYYRKKYKKNIVKNYNLSKETKNEVYTNSKALILYKIGDNLTHVFDGVIISTFVGVVVLGYYSNYLMIATGITSILRLAYTEVTSIIGESYIKLNKTQFLNLFKKAYIISFLLSLFFYLGYVAIGNEIVILIFGEGKGGNYGLIIMIAINSFVQFMRRSLELFKAASGNFHSDRFRPLVEGILNIVLSLIFVFIFEEIGVLLATTIACLAISFSFESISLFKYTFKDNVRKFMLIHYMTVLIFVIAIFIFKIIPVPVFENIYINILLNGTLSIIISLFISVLIFVVSKEYRIIIMNILKSTKKFIANKLTKYK